MKLPFLIDQEITTEGAPTIEPPTKKTHNQVYVDIFQGLYRTIFDEDTSGNMNPMAEVGRIEAKLDRLKRQPQYCPDLIDSHIIDHLVEHSADVLHIIPPGLHYRLVIGRCGRTPWLHSCFVFAGTNDCPTGLRLVITTDDDRFNFIERGRGVTVLKLLGSVNLKLRTYIAQDIVRP